MVEAVYLGDVFKRPWRGQIQ